MDAVYLYRTAPTSSPNWYPGRPWRSVLSTVLFVVWVAIAGGALFWGLDYYVLSPEERAFSSLALLFSPTGVVGHGLGIVGTAMIVIGVVGYGARKRLAALSRLGELRYWLKLHIFLCTLGPFLVVLHTTFKFGGIVSIAFWSMVVVVVSGVFGRYVYVRIPKTLNGRFLSLEAVRERAEELSARLRELAGLSGQELGVVFGTPRLETPNTLTGALTHALREDLSSRARRYRAHLLLRRRGLPANLRREVLALAREESRTLQQAVLLRPFQRLFGYWHVFHLPLAALMFAILGVHIAVAILFGYTWIF